MHQQLTESVERLRILYLRAGKESCHILVNSQDLDDSFIESHSDLAGVYAGRRDFCGLGSGSLLLG